MKQPPPKATKKNTVQIKLKKKLSGLAICGRPWTVEVLMQSKNACLTALTIAGFCSVREDCFY